MASLFTACSRPVAHFQPSAREQFTSPVAAVAAPVAVVPAVEGLVTAPIETPTAAPTTQLAQANAAVTQLQAYVRNDSKLSADKKLNKRMDRVKQLLATAGTKAATAPAATTSPKKMNLLERMATKRLDKQIKHRLAPEQTKRAMASTGILAAGAIAVVVGLLLLLLGGSNIIGLILLLAGAIVLVVGLLA